MNRRTKLATGFLAAILTLGAAGTASADPPPWAGRWKKQYNCDCDNDRDGCYRSSGRTYRQPTYVYRPTGGGSQCGAIIQRINKDRATIAQWQGSGRHEKVVAWSRGDLRNAYRDLDRCRRDPNYDYPYDNVQWPPRDDRYYDPYQGDPYYGSDPYNGSDPYYGRDPYYGAGVNGGFNLKTDWPLLVGALLNGNLR